MGPVSDGIWPEQNLIHNLLGPVHCSQQTCVRLKKLFERFVQHIRLLSTAGKRIAVRSSLTPSIASATCFRSFRRHTQMGGRRAINESRNVHTLSVHLGQTLQIGSID
jgi:hypothetical protein